MPYKLSDKGYKALKDDQAHGTTPFATMNLTQLQKKAFDYLYGVNEGMIGKDSKAYIESSEIARFYGLAPQAMRGPLHGLYLRGLVEKEV